MIPGNLERFPDLHPAFDSQSAVAEANRCLFCFDAPCMGACPTHIDVPRFIKKISTANLRGSMYSSYLLSAATGARGYPYRIWDTFASKHLVRGLTLYATVDNIFGSTDQKLLLPVPTFDRPDSGRTFRIGVRYSFIREGK